MNSKPLFILLALPALLLAITISMPAHAETVYLDGDAPTTTIVQLRPGDYAKITMPWDVTFSSTHGDDENVDSEVIVASLDIHVHLGNDNVLLTITDNGDKVYEQELAHQNGFVWTSQHSKGAVSLELIRDCYGNLKVYVNGKQVYSISGTDTSTTLDVLGDKDASLVSHGQYYQCSTNQPADYSGVGSMPRDNRLMLAAVGIGLAVALAVVIAVAKG